jgi:phosphoribosylformylglycinamidine cyclo-ligase
MAQKRTYADTGVDVNIEAKAAKILYKVAKQTWANRVGQLGEVIIPFDDFSGLRYIDVAKLPKGTVMYGGSDGVATKTEFAERANRFDTLAFDLMAMICDDAVIRGAEPVTVKTVLTVNTLGQDDTRLKYITQLGKGYIAAAKKANVVVINGEIAQHNNRMGSLHKFTLDWSGDVTWFANKTRLINGFKVKPGDYLIGLEEPGLRCNGTSLIRSTLKTFYGERWEDIKLGTKRLIELALAPSLIYSPAVVDMTGGLSLKRKPRAVLHGAAHITGGGIPEKLGRALKPSGLGALIDDPFVPGKLMAHCQEIGNISDREAYRTWNMGQGMILISSDFADIIKVAEEFGFKAKVIGRVTKKPGITIHSTGYNHDILVFN